MGIALQIDQDIDLVLMDPSAASRCESLRDVHELVEGTGEPGAHRAAVIRAVAIGNDLETIPVVTLEQSRHQLRRGVLMEIG